MSVLVNWNGSQYLIPTVGDEGWGTTVTNWIVDVANNGVTMNTAQTLSNKTFSDNLNLSGTGALKLNAGTTAQRPGSASLGMFRYNSELAGVEVYNGVAWTVLSGATGVFVEKAGSTMTGALLHPLGAPGTPSMAFAGDPDTGLYSPGADQIAVATGGVARLSIDSATVAATLPVSIPLGTGGAPSLTINGDPNTGLYSPGADQLALATAGATRLTLDTTAITVGVPVVLTLGTVSAPALTFLGDSNTGLYSPGFDQIAVVTNGAQRLAVDTTSATFSVPILAPAGSAASPGLAISGDTNTGLFSPVLDSLAVSTGGVEQVRVTHTASAVNRMELSGSATGNAVVIASAGSDSNVNVQIAPKGAGILSVEAGAKTTPVDNGAATGAVSVDLSASNQFTLTLTGNVTLDASNLAAGQCGHIVLTQDGTGGRTVSFASKFKFSAAAAPVITPSANARDVIAYYVLDASTVLCTAIQDIR